jgi:hypothetical protein
MPPTVTTISATFDGSVLRPEEPLNLCPNSRITLTFVEEAQPELPEDWTDVNNARRFELIDQEIQGGLSAEQRLELHDLQQRFHHFLDEVAPLPMERALQLHRELKKKQEKAKAVKKG